MKSNGFHAKKKISRGYNERLSIRICMAASELIRVVKKLHPNRLLIFYVTHIRFAQFLRHSVETGRDAMVFIGFTVEFI